MGEKGEATESGGETEKQQQDKYEQAPLHILHALLWVFMSEKDFKWNKVIENCLKYDVRSKFQSAVLSSAFQPIRQHWMCQAKKATPYKLIQKISVEWWWNVGFSSEIYFILRQKVHKTRVQVANQRKHDVVNPAKEEIRGKQIGHSDKHRF